MPSRLVPAAVAILTAALAAAAFSTGGGVEAAKYYYDDAAAAAGASSSWWGSYGGGHGVVEEEVEPEFPVSLVVVVGAKKDGVSYNGLEANRPCCSSSSCAASGQPYTGHGRIYQNGCKQTAPGRQ
ncbi:hypothetical protein E2562_002343 [Oryza meyeriana var. granulata]|uniref:Kazal-like domain-containing protein n=1 Tax=Oryza meyeriana var. granulata TaxID=110450 RepID=A0A6G1BI56_9ORYZ|nr:hypothetical protein E2562_002343 [Oryza meyeriana var. granulata]